MSGNGYYNEGGLKSVFAFPLVWPMLAGFWKNDGQRQETRRIYLWTSLLVAIACAACVIFSFVSIGVTDRYTCDILLPIMLLACVALLNLDNGMKNSTVEKPARALLAAACIFTVLVGAAWVFSNHRNTIFWSSPDTYVRFYNLFSPHT